MSYMLEDAMQDAVQVVRSSKMTQEQSLLRTMLVHALTREQKTLKKIPSS